MAAMPRGPVLAGVRDSVTGEVFHGINHIPGPGGPEDHALHPFLQARVNQLRAHNPDPDGAPGTLVSLDMKTRRGRLQEAASDLFKNHRCVTHNGTAVSLAEKDAALKAEANAAATAAHAASSKSSNMSKGVESLLKTVESQAPGSKERVQADKKLTEKREEAALAARDRETTAADSAAKRAALEQHLARTREHPFRGLHEAGLAASRSPRTRDSTWVAEAAASMRSMGDQPPYQRPAVTADHIPGHHAEIYALSRALHRRDELNRAGHTPPLKAGGDALRELLLYNANIQDPDKINLVPPPCEYCRPLTEGVTLVLPHSHAHPQVSAHQPPSHAPAPAASGASSAAGARPTSSPASGKPKPAATRDREGSNDKKDKKEKKEKPDPPTGGKRQ